MTSPEPDPDRISRRTVLRTTAGATVGLGLFGVASPAGAQECGHRDLNVEVGEITLDDPRLPIVLDDEGRCVPESAPVACTVEDVALTGPDTDEFSLRNVPSLPATVEPGDCFTVDLVFHPTSAGEKEVTVTSDGTCGDRSGTVCTRVTATVASSEESSDEPPEDPSDELPDDLAESPDEELRERAQRRVSDARAETQQQRDEIRRRLQQRTNLFENDD